MTAIRELLTQIPDPNLSTNERVRLRCQLARQFERTGHLLGLPGHQSLNFILKHRHPELLNARTPIKPRRRRILKLINSQKDASNE